MAREGLCNNFLVLKLSLFKLRDIAYQGRLLLVSQVSTLLAINYVDFEEYLASVVGGEMSAGEPIKALKK